MHRRIILPVVLGTALLGVVPALADANGSTEQRTVDRKCSEPSHNQYSDPGPTDCRDANGNRTTSGTYRATHYSNDVQCGGTNRLAGPTPNGLSVYGTGNTSSGSVGTCSEGGGAAPAPIQGRAGVSGSASSGLKVVVDGDKDNPNETSQGYIIIEQKPAPGAPTYRCGDEYSQGGRADSDSPQDRDTAAECGS